MTITFALGGKPFKAEVNAKIDNGELLWYEVELQNGARFTLEKKEGKWISDFVDVSKNLVKTTGYMIEQIQSKQNRFLQNKN